MGEPTNFWEIKADEVSQNGIYPSVVTSASQVKPAWSSGRQTSIWELTEPNKSSKIRALSTTPGAGTITTVHQWQSDCVKSSLKADSKDICYVCQLTNDDTNKKYLATGTLQTPTSMESGNTVSEQKDVCKNIATGQVGNWSSKVCILGASQTINLDGEYGLWDCSGA